MQPARESESEKVEHAGSPRRWPNNNERHVAAPRYVHQRPSALAACLPLCAAAFLHT